MRRIVLVVLIAAFVALPGSAATRGVAGGDVPTGMLLFSDWRDYRARTVEIGVPGLYLIDASSKTRRALNGSFYHGVSPDWSPSGGRIAFARWLGTPVDSRDGRDGAELVVAQQDGTRAHVIVASTEGLEFPGDPEWSPNGQQLVFSASGIGYGSAYLSAVYVANAGGSHKRLLMPRTTHWTSEPTWAPDGRAIAFVRIARERGSIYRIRVGDRTPELLVVGASAPAWSPRGHELAYLSDQGGIYILDLATRMTRYVTRTCNVASGPAWSPDGRWLAFSDCVRPPSTHLEPRALVTVQVDGRQRRVVDSLGVKIGQPSWR